MPTPSNYDPTLDSNQEMNASDVKSVAIDEPNNPNNQLNETNCSNADLLAVLAEIRRLNSRLEAVEVQLEREFSLEEESNQVVDSRDSTCEAEPKDGTGAVNPVVVVSSEAKEIQEPDPHPPRRLSQSFRKKKERFTPVRFEESAWSIPLVIGLADVGWLDTVGALILVLVNVGMQTAFSSILLSEPFMGESFDTNLDSARIWRRSLREIAVALAFNS